MSRVTAHFAIRSRSARLLRVSARDGVPLGAALALGLALGGGVFAVRSPGACALAAVVMALSLCWTSNTVSHIHLHSPLFRARWQNRGFSIYLSLLLGIPQGLWRQRHLWHHAGEPAGGPRPLRRQGWLELLLVASLFLVLLALAPRFFLRAYLPGYLLGLLLCQLQGRYEHGGASVRAHPGVSIYSRLYNLLCFNDGYHAEHHRHVGAHWTRLPDLVVPGAARSRLPPVLRFLEEGRVPALLLVYLERCALWLPVLQRFMLRTHERAFRVLLPRLSVAPRRVCIIGGGLFPRTLLCLHRLLPAADFTVVDASADSVARARRFLLRHQPALLLRVVFLQERYDPQRPSAAHRADLLVVPLGFQGARCFRASQSPVLVHDWLWRRQGRGVIISLLLCKRLNLIAAEDPR